MMQGLVLSRRFWEDVVRPKIEMNLPDALSYLAAGLCGEGSECFSFYDAISRDHDWGPGVMLFLEKKDAPQWEERLRQLYASLPKSFLGVPPRQDIGGSKRVGVLTMEGFFQRLTGFEKGPQTLADWMHCDEARLSMAVNGSLFYDAPGAMTETRRRLKTACPRDVWLTKMAHDLFYMAQGGQYNYPRCTARKDLGAMTFSKSGFLFSAMQLIHHLNHAYAPFYKWLYRSVGTLSETYGTLPLFEDLLMTQDTERSMTLIEAISERLSRALMDLGLVPEGVGTFLTEHALYVQAKIKDDKLRCRNIMEEPRLWKR